MFGWDLAGALFRAIGVDLFCAIRRVTALGWWPGLGICVAVGRGQDVAMTWPRWRERFWACDGLWMASVDRPLPELRKGICGCVLCQHWLRVGSTLAQSVSVSQKCLSVDGVDVSIFGYCGHLLTVDMR